MMLLKLSILSVDVQVGTRRKNTFNTLRNLLHMWLRLKVMMQIAGERSPSMLIK